MVEHTAGGRVCYTEEDGMLYLPIVMYPIDTNILAGGCN